MGLGLVDLADVPHPYGVTMRAGDPDRALVEHAPVMIWRAGLDGRCEDVNATWLSFTGRALDQALGTGWEQSIHPDDWAARRALYLEHVQRRTGFEIEYRLRRHDGVDRYVLERAVPYAPEGGAFVGFVGICLDVDERHAREIVHDADAYFEMSLDHLCVAGFDGYFKRLNPAWTRTLQWSSDELMARPSLDFVHPEDRPHVLAARDGLNKGVPLHSLANRYLAKDGTYRWLEWRSVPHVDWGLVYAVARDVTDEIEARRALRELTQSLTTTLDSIADGVISDRRRGRDRSHESGRREAHGLGAGGCPRQAARPGVPHRERRDPDPGGAAGRAHARRRNRRGAVAAHAAAHARGHGAADRQQLRADAQPRRNREWRGPRLP